MSRHQCQQGFSLVELMVALVISLLITLGAFQLFLVGKKSFDHELALAERQSSLRFLVDSISYDIRSASYTDFLD
ncbi:MAG TPA: prepilin-type N-terminal cleavage/methylation domain-containing protein, partial [Candidatus Obscuribacterales bacterium]